MQKYRIYEFGNIGLCKNQEETALVRKQKTSHLGPEAESKSP